MGANALSSGVSWGRCRGRSRKRPLPASPGAESISRLKSHCLRVTTINEHVPKSRPRAFRSPGRPQARPSPPTAACSKSQQYFSRRSLDTCPAPALGAAARGTGPWVTWLCVPAGLPPSSPPGLQQREREFSVGSGNSPCACVLGAGTVGTSRISHLPLIPGRALTPCLPRPPCEGPAST